MAVAYLFLNMTPKTLGDVEHLRAKTADDGKLEETPQPLAPTYVLSFIRAIVIATTILILIGLIWGIKVI